MKRGELPCRNCTHSAITLQVLPQLRANSFCNVTNELVIYCQIRKANVKYPYEFCKERKEKHTLTLVDEEKVKL